jgi:adenosylcobinamide kinase / adenosylcobinamide-phosphate guanylyltransferase
VPDLGFERFTLVLGGARSGKSRHAEALIAAHRPPWIYVATAQALDAEMAARIAEHRSRRDRRWHTLEAPRDLPQAISGAPPDAPLLIDCLTLWLANAMLADADLGAAVDGLEAALGRRRASVVAVANEVGLGIVPDTVLGRRFRDAAGTLNQRLAVRADRVVLLVAGIAMTLKGPP